MSLLPLLFDDSLFCDHPLNNLHHNLSQLSLREPTYHRSPSSLYLHLFPGQELLDNWRNALVNQETNYFDKDKFVANVDVQQFKPEEITVKVTDKNTVTIEGKHEEKQDEHGFISRHFVRKFVLPENVDMSQVQSKLSSDGVLSITAPKIVPERKEQFREIPITRTGPIKQVQQKEGEGDKKKEQSKL